MIGEHVGSHEEIGLELAMLRDRILKEGLTPSGGPLELFWSDPVKAYDTSTWNTWLVWSIKENVPVAA